MNQLYQQMQDPIIQRFNQFKQNFTGDPKAQVQQLLNSGRISQEQYNTAVQKANQMARLFGIH